MSSEREDRLRRLCEALRELTSGQMGWGEAVVQQFRRPAEFRRLPVSDIINDCVPQDFGDALRIHHCFSREPFTKDKFEFALERVVNLCGMSAALAPKGNPGHDITLNGIRFSLKTQADRSMRSSHLHISKFMELGRGKWGDEENDLAGLRDQFLQHMVSYDRILSLRLLSRQGEQWHYELVEIPKVVLEEVRDGSLRMNHRSRQFPKPGYCYVTDTMGNSKFQLYFDGGTERKLQIQKLAKAYCIVHAEWVFEAG